MITIELHHKLMMEAFKSGSDEQERIMEWWTVSAKDSMKLWMIQNHHAKPRAENHVHVLGKTVPIIQHTTGRHHVTRQISPGCFTSRVCGVRCRIPSVQSMVDQQRILRAEHEVYHEHSWANRYLEYVVPSTSSTSSVCGALKSVLSSFDVWLYR